MSAVGLRPWTNFQHDVALFQIGFRDDCICDSGVFQNVLSQVLVHLEDSIAGGGCGLGVRCVGGSMLALFGFDLGHSHGRAILSGVFLERTRLFKPSSMDFGMETKKCGR